MLRSKTKNVPAGVRVIAYFSFIAGFWFISQSISIFTSTSLDSIVMMVDGVVNIAIGVGFTFAARWSWTVRMILSVVLLIEATLTLSFLIIDGTFTLPEYSEDSVFSIGALIINPLILYYLYRPCVKAYFGKFTTTEYTVA
jgi:hypothetical protein